MQSFTLLVHGDGGDERYKTRLGVAYGQLAHLEVAELLRLRSAINRLMATKEDYERVLTETVGGES